MHRILKSSECKLLGGLFSYLIQIFLGLVALCSLIYKRHIEIPKRKWKIWLFDVGKQLIGGFFIHCINILLSSYLKGNNDECAFYFLNFFIDCTLGVLIVYMVHDGTCYIIKKYINESSIFADIGEYGDPPKIIIWVMQMSLYLFSLIINKIIIGLIFYYLINQMNYVSAWIFGSLEDKPNIELIIVMIICPWILTTFQMWIFDYILKSKNKKNNLITENLIQDQEALDDYSINSECSYTDDSFSSVTLSN
jgi:hypothetical protein